MERDPVCGMKVDPTTKDGARGESRGRTVYFCSEQCKREFETNPSRYRDAVR